MDGVTACVYVYLRIVYLCVHVYLRLCSLFRELFGGGGRGGGGGGATLLIQIKPNLNPMG